jgi:predicted RNA-binding protein
MGEGAAGKMKIRLIFGVVDDEGKYRSWDFVFDPAVGDGRYIIRVKKGELKSVEHVIGKKILDRRLGEAL